MIINKLHRQLFQHLFAVTQTTINNKQSFRIRRKHQHSSSCFNPWNKNLIQPISKQNLIDVGGRRSYNVSPRTLWETISNTQFRNNRNGLHNCHNRQTPTRNANCRNKSDMRFSSCCFVLSWTWFTRHNLEFVQLTLTIDSCFIHIHNQLRMSLS